MYTCHLHIALLGKDCLAFRIIREMPPLANFVHYFTDDPHEADLLFLNLDGSADPAKDMETALAAKREDAMVIPLATHEDKYPYFVPILDQLADVWKLPMTENEIRFRFRNCQTRFKADKDAWQTTQYLEATINSVPSLVWYKNKEGIHVKVNDAFCKTVNKPKEIVEGRDHCFIWGATPEEAEVCAVTDRKVMESGKICVAEETVPSSEGTKILTTYKSTLYDLDGSIMGTVGVGIDVTRERAYEKELVEKNRSLEAIFTALECGVLCHTVDGTKLLNINDAALTILGFHTKEEMVDSGFLMVASTVLDEDKSILRDAIQSLTEVGDSVNIKYRVVHPDGSIHHIMGNIKLLEENGERFYQRFLLDVTAEHLQEEAKTRRQNEQMQALAVDFNLALSYDLDTGLGTILRSNQQVPEDVLANARDGVLPVQSFLDYYIDTYVYEPDREIVRHVTSVGHLKKHLVNEGRVFLSYRRMVDGRPSYFEMRAARAGVWRESHLVVLGFHDVDIATRKELEKRDALQSALIQANRANAAKSAFLSNMSHDIRTPLNAIVGFTALAVSHIAETDHVLDYLHKIQVSGDHLLNLINDVLDMSRIESGKMHLDVQEECLPDLLREVASIIQPAMKERGQHFTMDLSGITHQRVVCDKLHMNQIMLNVLSNATKYTKFGGEIQLTVTEHPGAVEGHADYEFRCKDNGVGMTAEFLKHVFEPFERAGNTTLSGVQGTGLGMPITKNLVDLMKGSIKIESEEGKGTEVIIFLNLPIIATADPQAASPSEEIHPLAAKHQRILLVEDNELNREIAQAILEDAGFVVEFAENGKIAVEKIEAAQPGYYSVVLMDIQMPVMNGYEAARAIRKLKNQELAKIPILAMTANAFEEDRQEALRSGMNGHIAKPINIPLLMETLGKLLG